MNQNIHSIVSSSFQKANPSCYWHYIVKNYPEKSFYEKKENINKKVTEIAIRLGENSFERKDAHGLTPLHVAVLTGNVEGIRFLIDQGVSCSIQDDYQKTAIDYAKECHQELLDLFPLPLSTQHAYSEILNKWHVPLDKASCEYMQNSNDFGVEIKEILISDKYANHFGNADPEKIVSLNGKLTLDLVTDHLEEVLINLGVIVKKTKLPYAVRDHFIKLPNGEFRKQCLSETMEKCHEKAISLGFYFNTVGYTRTSHNSFKGFSGASRNLAKRTTHETEHVFSNPKELKLQVEGGNMFLLTNQKGAPQVLIGQEHFYTTLNYHLLNKTFSAEEIETNIRDTFTLDEIYQAAEEMYAEGRLKLGKNTGFLNRETMMIFRQDKIAFKISSVPEKEHGHTLRKLAIAKGLLKPFLLSQTQIEECRPLVLKYLSQKDLVKKLITQELGIGENDLHCILPMLYHLDTFLKPGPKHSVFIADFAMNAEIITMLLNQADTLNLSNLDKELLKRYLTTSDKLNNDLSPMLQEIRKQIENANLKAIPIPGLFFDDPQLKNTFNFNLMNALTGWSSKTGRYYYITTGIHAGDQLGDILMKLFTKCLQSYESQLDVFYIGSPKHNRKDFSKVMFLWNDASAQAGPHCFSMETKTASHIG